MQLNQRALPWLFCDGSRNCDAFRECPTSTKPLLKRRGVTRRSAVGYPFVIYFFPLSALFCGPVAGTGTGRGLHESDVVALPSMRIERPDRGVCWRISAGTPERRAGPAHPQAGQDIGISRRFVDAIVRRANQPPDVICVLEVHR